VSYNMTYDFSTLKEAILFNTQEVLPTDTAQLDNEIRFLIDHSNVSGQEIRHYIGFEISGQIHIGTGIASALKIKRLQDAGVKCSIWLADYHTELNQKLDGKIETIRKVAREYFAPVMRKCLEIVGCDADQVDILFAEDVYQTQRNNQDMLTFLLKISQELTLNRVLKSISVTGKEAGDNVNFGTLQYAPLQVADAFFMQTHLVHAGMDQRKCHVLMREIATKLPESFQLKIGNQMTKPIAIHHNLLLGLEHKGDDTEVAKMSKSKPDSAIWVHDNLEEIQRKLKKAYCPMVQENQSREQMIAEQALNPLLDWCKNMIYPGGQIVSVERPDKFGGNKTYTTFAELEDDYMASNLHPMDLKNGVAQSLASWFSPIIEYTNTHPTGLELVKNVRI
jgi:tyrosyl-tRNA synthetase